MEKLQPDPPDDANAHPDWAAVLYVSRQSYEGERGGEKEGSMSMQTLQRSYEKVKESQTVKVQTGITYSVRFYG